MREGCLTERFIAEVARSAWPRPVWIGADPAGGQRSAQTGVSEITLWKRAGFAVRSRASRIHEGLDAVRRRLRSADDEPTLFIAPRCARLIESLTMYHYPPGKPESLDPVKDGHDHAADALRYLIVNLDRGDWSVKVRTY